MILASPNEIFYSLKTVRRCVCSKLRCTFLTASAIFSTPMIILLAFSRQCENAQDCRSGICNQETKTCDCFKGFKLDPSGSYCARDKCSFSDEGECSGAGDCVFTEEKGYECICHNEYALAEYACRGCVDGYKYYSGVCYPSYCGDECSYHGNCLFFTNMTFGCRCYSNYNISSDPPCK